MEESDPGKSTPRDQNAAAGGFDAEVEEGERSSGEYCFVYHEVARITTVRKSIPARKPEPSVAGTPKPSKRAEDQQD